MFENFHQIRITNIGSNLLLSTRKPQFLNLKLSEYYSFYAFSAKQRNHKSCKTKKFPYGHEASIFIKSIEIAIIIHLMQRTDSLEKTLMLGNNEGRRRRG